MTREAQTVLVTADAFESGLRALDRDASDPRAGLFGPHSQMWRIARESGVFLGAGAALLLQLAHPFVAYGISDHSRALHDPIARFHRTFSPIFTMIFGTPAEAIAAARRVRHIHDHINGRLGDGAPYSAHDTDALHWVHMTLWHTAMRVYENVITPLSKPEKDQFIIDVNRFAILFGIAPDRQDATWAGFEARFAAVLASHTLAVTAPARRIADHFVGRNRESFGRHLPRWYTTVTADLLPPALASGFGLSRDDAKAHDTWRNIARWYHRAPRTIRDVAPYHEAHARLRDRRPSLMTAGLNRVWLGRARLGAGT